MLNIPTDLLRTLVAVVDLRSFTKAAQIAGRDAAGGERPDQAAAVAARLRDARQARARREPDAARRGVVNHARRLLSINDEIMQAASSGSRGADAAGRHSGRLCGLADSRRSLAKFRQRWPDIGFVVSSGSPDNLLRGLQPGRPRRGRWPSRSRSRPSSRATAGCERRSGCTATRPGSIPTGRCRWSATARIAPASDVAVDALRRAGRECDFVFTSLQPGEPGGRRPRRLRRHGDAARARAAQPA